MWKELLYLKTMYFLIKTIIIASLTFLANMPEENDISQLLHHPLQMNKIKALKEISNGSKYVMKGIPQ